MHSTIFKLLSFTLLTIKKKPILISRYLKIIITENPHTVLHGRFLINQCFSPLNEPGFNFYTYYGFLSFNSNKPGGEINRKNYLKIKENF